MILLEVYDLKLNGIGSNEHFDGVSAFTAEISGLPQSIQDEAKKIDGEAYNASCFEMYIYYDLETGAFTVSTEKDPATGEDCNVYYVDDNGDKHWFKVEMPEEFTSEVFAACTKNMEEKIHGYEVKRSVVFENNRGFALAENPDAPQPFVTWQFSEKENGRRDYYWGHYTTDGEAALT